MDICFARVKMPTKPRLDIHSTATQEEHERGCWLKSHQDLLVIECGFFLGVIYFVPVACLGSCETITSGGRLGRKFTLVEAIAQQEIHTSRSHCTAVID